MTKKVRALIVAVALLAAGLVAGAEKSDAYIPGFPSSCYTGQSSGPRVCFDQSAQRFYFINAGGTIILQFPSNSGYSPGHTAYQGFYGVWDVDPGGTDEAYYNGATGRIHVRPWQGNGYGVDQLVIRPDACYDTGGQICVYGGNFNYIAWYVNTPEWQFMIST